MFVHRMIYGRGRKSWYVSRHRASIHRKQGPGKRGSGNRNRSRLAPTIYPKSSGTNAIHGFSSSEEPMDFRSIQPHDLEMLLMSHAPGPADADVEDVEKACVRSSVSTHIVYLEVYLAVEKSASSHTESCRSSASDEAADKLAIALLEKATPGGKQRSATAGTSVSPQDGRSESFLKSASDADKENADNLETAETPEKNYNVPISSCAAWDDVDVSVPNAIRVHPSYFEAGENTNKYYPYYGHPSDGKLLPDDELWKALAAKGIHEDSVVVVYGRGQVPTMTACRAVWALLYANVRSVYLLDGGFPAWVKHVWERVSSIDGFQGGSTSGRVRGHHNAVHNLLGNLNRHPQSVSSFGSLRRRRESLLATTEQVVRWQGSVACDCQECVDKHECPARESSATSEAVLIDVRRLDEHEGNGCSSTHYGFFESSGRIPGSVWQGNWDNLVTDCSEMLPGQPDHATREQMSDYWALSLLASKIVPQKLRLAETQARWSTELGIPPCCGSDAVEIPCFGGGSMPTRPRACEQVVDQNMQTAPPPTADFRGPLIFYCGTGWRSCIGVVIAVLLGYKDVKNYDGGFYDWSYHGTNPVTKGRKDYCVRSKEMESRRALPLRGYDIT